MKEEGQMKKSKFDDTMIIGGGLFIPIQEKGIRLPYIESKPIWRLIYDAKQKRNTEQLLQPGKKENTWT